MDYVGLSWSFPELPSFQARFTTRIAVMCHLHYRPFKAFYFFYTFLNIFTSALSIMFSHNFEMIFGYMYRTVRTAQSQSAELRNISILSCLDEYPAMAGPKQYRGHFPAPYSKLLPPSMRASRMGAGNLNLNIIFIR